MRVRGEREHHLLAARVTGAAALGIVAQIAVDMPGGYFGGADRITPWGAAYSAGLVALTLLLLAALARRWRSGMLLVPLILSLDIGVFVPPIGSDPLVSGIVVLWNLLLLAQFYFPPGADDGSSHIVGASEVDVWLRRWSPAIRHLAAVSLVLTVAVVGYRLSGRLTAQLVCLALGYGVLGLGWPFVRMRWRAGSRKVSILAVPVAASLLFVGSPPAMLSWLAVAQALLLLVLVAQHQSAVEILRHFYDHPSRLIVLSFATVILIGTVLLTFPGAAAGPGAVSPIDALFTATSATCVTGLIVLDTPHAFSTLGHGIILGLIQVGGLGIMVLSTFATLMLGGTLGLRGERALTEVLDLPTADTAYRLTRFIVVVTLAVEAVGAVVLGVCYAVEGLPAGQAAWRGVFHAISAFCNAGFALQSDSVVMFQRQPGALLTFAALITLGGLGFAVLAGVARLAAPGGPRLLTVQVRAVLAASAVLVAAGTLLYAAVEWDRTLAGLPWSDKLVNALFQSVTLRTAGFNSVDFAALAPATILVMIVFMFIGASPGSTGGGIKTTTAVVLLAAIRSTVRAGEPARLFEREVPVEIVYRSLAILVISGAVIAAGLFGLLLFEPLPFAELAFEVMSAFGTVGLSLGATPELGPVGKLFIIAVMFTGRVGPLTVALLLGRSAGRAIRVRLPESRIMVG